MKKLILAISVCAVGILFSSTSIAAETATAPAQGSGMMGGEHPCHKIEEACKAAGYVRGGAKTDKGLVKNCMAPLMAGQSVSGVSITSADVQACQAKRNANKSK